MASRWPIFSTASLRVIPWVEKTTGLARSSRTRRIWEAVSPKAKRASRRLGGPRSAISSSHWASPGGVARLEASARQEQFVAGDDRAGDDVDRVVRAAASFDPHPVRRVGRAEADVFHSRAAEICIQS